MSFLMVTASAIDMYFSVRWCAYQLHFSAFNQLLKLYSHFGQIARLARHFITRENLANLVVLSNRVKHLRFHPGTFTLKNDVAWKFTQRKE